MRRASVWGAALTAGGAACAVLPGFLLAGKAGPCLDMGWGATVLVRTSLGPHLPVPILQQCAHAAPLAGWYFTGFALGAAGLLLLLGAPPKRSVLAALVALVFALAFVMPYVPNSDPYAYALYAWNGLQGRHPYAVQQLHGGPPAMAAIAALFPGSDNYLTACAYGPAFLAVYALSAGPLLPVSLYAAIAAERAVGAATLLLLALTMARLQRDEDARTRAFAAIALNPLLVFESISFAHGDVLMLAFLAGAYAAFVRRRFALAALLCVLAAETRSIALLGSAVLFAELLHRRAYRDLSRAGAAAVCCAAATWAASRWLFGGFSIGPSLTLTAAIYAVTPPMLVGRFALEAAVMALLLRARAYSALAPVALLSLPSVLPWYWQWLAPVAAATRDARYRAAMAASMLLGPILMYPEMVQHTNGRAAIFVITAMQLLVPALVYWMPARRAVIHPA